MLGLVTIPLKLIELAGLIALGPVNASEKGANDEGTEKSRKTLGVVGTDETGLANATETETMIVTERETENEDATEMVSVTEAIKIVMTATENVKIENIERKGVDVTTMM